MSPHYSLETKINIAPKSGLSFIFQTMRSRLPGNIDRVTLECPWEWGWDLREIKTGRSEEAIASYVPLFAQPQKG